MQVTPVYSTHFKNSITQYH